MPIKIRKRTFPEIEVYYKDDLIGVLENSEELLLFRTDIIGNTECENYILHSVDKQFTVNEYGHVKPYSDEIEPINVLLKGIIDKQMSWSKEHAKK